MPKRGVIRYFLLAALIFVVLLLLKDTPLFWSYLRLLDNLLLFFLVLILPIIIASKLEEKVVISPFKIKKKETAETYELSLTAPSYRNKYIAEGVGLLYGSVFSIFYNLIDFFFIKRSIPYCNDFCGIENFLSSIFSLIFVIIGSIFVRKYSSFFQS